MPPEAQPERDLTYAPVRVLTIPQRVSDDDLTIINERFAATELALEDVFTFPGVISTDAVDSYYTHMDAATSLRNFVADFAAGQALLDSHDIYRLPIGSSFRAELQDVPGGKAEGVPATKQVVAGFYMLRGHAVGGQEIDQYIRGIIGGVHRKMSIGFGGPEMHILCDVDGSDIWDWDSDYWPGQVLDDGTVVTYGVYDARGYEGSLVYKNATPGAIVGRVAHLVEKRAIPPSEVARLEHRWGVRFDVPGRAHVVTARAAAVAASRRNSMADIAEQVRGILEKIEQRAGKKLSKATRDSLSGAIATLSNARAGVEEVETALATLLESADAATESDDTERAAILAEIGEQPSVDVVRALKTRAVAGDRYAERRIDEAVKARVAVAGDTFDGDKYKQRLQRAALAGDIEWVEEEAESWETQRKQAYHTGRIASIASVNRMDGPNEGHGLEIEERAV